MIESRIIAATLLCSVLIFQPSGAFAGTNAAPVPTNSAITAKVKSALDADPDLKKYDINVSTSGDTVRLDGMVHWISEKEKAVQIASRVDGFGKIEDVIGIDGVNSMTP